MRQNRTRFILVGIGASIVAIIATLILALAFSIVLALAVVAAMAGVAGPETISIIVEGLFLPVSGGLAGVASGLASGAAIRRLWRPTHRWLAGWVAAWTLGGAGIWLIIWVRHEALTPTEMFLNSSAMWLLFGLALALVCSAMPPWSRHE